MELCDEVGFYVLDEIPSCWVASEINDPSRTWAYIFRSKETLARDKNRACVVAWSCGNESSYGINNQAEFDYAKAHDPTRLAFISQQNLRPEPQDRLRGLPFSRVWHDDQADGHQPRPRQGPRHPHRISSRRRRPPGGRGPQLGRHVAHRRHRRRLHLGMAGPGHVRQVPRALEHPRPRRAGSTTPRPATASRAPGAPSPPIASPRTFSMSSSRFTAR